MGKLECENCGEVLFGAVNRCWKCGTDVKVVAAPRLPPIRRSPVKLRRRVHAPGNEGGNDGGMPSLGSVSDVMLSAKQVLPWFLNLEVKDETRERMGAIAVGLGVIGCLLGIASAWSILFGIVGAVFGLLGMPAKRRDLATMGLVVSVLAFFLGLGQIVFDTYTYYDSQKWIEELQSGN